MKEELTYKDILFSDEAKQYIKAGNLIKVYYQNKTIPPYHIKKSFNNALQRYREFLRGKGIHMPKPLYPFNKDDPSTWFFLECVIYEIKGTRQYVTTRENPDCIYRKNNKNIKL